MVGTMSLAKLQKKRSRRVIEELRKRFPGTWSYDHAMHRWNHADGWYVEARSAMAPQYDGDDDTFVTHYYAINRPDSTSNCERLYL